MSEINVSERIEAPSQEKSLKDLFHRFFQRIAADRPLLLIILISLLCLGMSLSFPESFPRRANFAAVLLDTAQSGILTVGMMLLLVGGVFDLSIGSIMAFSGIVAGVFVKDLGVSAELSFLIGILVGTVCGTLNGFIITRLRINALITTLAMQGILRGVTQIVAPAGVANLPQDFRPYGQVVFLGLQSPFWVMLVVVLLGWFMMQRTRFFRQYYFIGSNPKAAALSGIKVDYLMLISFTLMGTLAGLAGTLLASRLSNAVVLAGVGVELKSITAAILGGASLAGGVGTIPGAFLGVLFMSLIQNTLIIARVPVFYQNIVVGIVLLVAIGIDQIGRRR
ncbi:MAG: ABC transporter permease [Anaerolineales bacterium]|nr:ABC transporter permease [Anaerolineales bacterium]